MANINETYAQRHYESALDYFEQGNYTKALQQIESAIQKAPNNPDFYSTKGVFLHRMNDIARAIEAYEKAISVFPNHTFSHYNLGLIFMKEGKVLQAIQQWEEVIKTKPDDVDSVFNIAVAFSQLGKAKQAIPYYQRVLEIDPSHVMTHQNLGVIYRDEHDFTQAKMHFNILKDLDSTYSEVVSKEIFRCEEQEFLEKMEEEKRIAASFAGTGDDSNLGRALSALIAENYEKALDYANISLDFAKTTAQTKADDIAALLVKGQALAGMGKYEDALIAFEDAVKLNSDEAEAFFHMGAVSLTMGKLPQALSYFEQAYRLKPEMPLLEENIASIRNFIGKEGGSTD